MKFTCSIMLFFCTKCGCHAHTRMVNLARPCVPPGTYGKAQLKIFSSGQVPPKVKSWLSHVHPGTQTVSDPVHAIELEDFRIRFNAIRAEMRAQGQPTESTDFEGELEDELIGQQAHEPTLGGIITPGQCSSESD